MQPRQTYYRSAALGLILLLTACSPLRPSDPVRFYDLNTVLGSPGDSGGPTLLIGPFELPEYLKRPQLVVRQGNRLELREFDRWAEPLDEAVLRRLTTGIGAAASTNRVHQFPEVGSPDYAFRITGRILRLESNAAGETSLQARWRLLDDRGKTIGGPFSTRHSGQLNNQGDMGAMAAELGRLLDLLSADIAAVVTAQTTH